MELLVVALTLVLGFVLGLIVGARRAFTLVASGRTLRTASARVAAYMPVTPPTRSAEDILAGRVRIILGPIAYDLPVLPRAASKRWLESLDARFAALASLLEDAETTEIMTILVNETDGLYDLLLSYDQSHLLPPREEVDEVATDAQVLHAVLEVWRAVHPLADSLITTAAIDGSSPEPLNGPRPNTAGAPSSSTTG